MRTFHSGECGGIAKKRRHLEFRGFYAKIKFGISAYFFCEKRGECGGLSVKMDSRFRGNDGGEAGVCRRESDGGGGDSDLHRNGKSWKLGKKNLPFRRTPESLRRF